MELINWLNSFEINEINILSCSMILFYFSLALEFILTFAYVIKSGVKSLG